MKLNLVDQDNDKLELEVSGEGHSFLNLLQNYILKEKNVKMAGYSKVHPLMDRCLLFVTLNRGKNYKKVLLNASDKTGKHLTEFQIKFNKAVEK